MCIITFFFISAHSTLYLSQKISDHK